MNLKDFSLLMRFVQHDVRSPRCPLLLLESEDLRVESNFRGLGVHSAMKVFLLTYDHLSCFSGQSSFQGRIKHKCTNQWEVRLLAADPWCEYHVFHCLTGNEWQRPISTINIAY